MRTPARRLALLALPILLGATACLPYTVGSTAQTIPTGRTATSMTYYYIPNALKRSDDTVGVPMAGIDREWRHGLDEHSDVGVRLTSGAGIVVNYKQRFRDYDGSGPALAYMLGTGVVNAGEHLHLEGTLIASGDERSNIMPFGGLRAMQVLPLSAGAAHDSPTIGAFGGVQLGDAAFAIRPELGIFYDRSALGLRAANYIFVPAVTIQRRESRHDGSREISRPEMRGSAREPRERSTSGLIRCLILSCSSADDAEHAARPSVMRVY